MYYKQKNRTGGKCTMSEKEGVRRKNNLEKSWKEFLKDENVTDKALISGRIDAEFEHSHEVRREKFYQTRVRVKRLSGIEDLVPIVVSDSLIGDERMKTSFKDKWVEVVGQFRSYDRKDKDGKRHLELFLCATTINIYDDERELVEVVNENRIYLNGYLCIKPKYKKTQRGIEITNFIIAVKKNFGKSYYIPCIAWGRVAKWASGLEVGNQVEIYGRIQSRKYFKRFSKDSDKGEDRIAYEIFGMEIKKVDEELI